MTTAEDPTKTGNDPVSSRERLQWLRRSVLIWLVALLLLAIVAIGSLFAAGVFTAMSANPANVFSSGILQIHNDKEGAVILTATHLVPGDSESGQVTITNTGTVDGHFSLEMTGLMDPNPGQDDMNLSDQLDLTIMEGDNPTAIYTGKLSAMDGMTIPLPPEWAPMTSRTYTFTVSFPSTGTDTGDNIFQDAQAQADFIWHATSS